MWCKGAAGEDNIINPSPLKKEIMIMTRSSQKSKRVSWASDINLRQIRLFLSEDSPSQVRVGAQDNLQIKTSWILHSSGAGSDVQLPPGFEGSQSSDELKKELYQIPLVKWECPPKFVLNPHWQVVAGEENIEAEVQKQRELRVLEAIYPRPSAIPTSPAVSSEVEELPCQDHQIPHVPVTPIEEEDVAHDPPTTTRSSPSSPGSSPKPQSNNILPATSQPHNTNEPDVVAAASAAFTAIMKSNEQGSLIDHDLLIKILNNPQLIGKLLTDYGTSSNNNLHTLPVQSSLSGYGSRVESKTPLSAPPPPPPSTSSSSGFFQPVTNAVAPTTLPPAPAVKDIFYYKSLIQQHGGEKPDTQDQPIQRDSKPKNKKPCIYFNSSRGCKNGANCAYQHGILLQQKIGGIIQEAPSAKRIKLDRETGRPLDRI